MRTADRPALILCSHGTSSPEGRRAIRSIVDDVALLLPEVVVHEAFVDVEQPRIDAVTARTTATGCAVVVPLLLSTGYHTRVDIGRAVSVSAGRAVATQALGPHPLLADVLHDRLVAVGADPASDAVVLAGAGSSDPQAAEDVRATAALLAAQGGWNITTGFAASAAPTIAEAVDFARAQGLRRVIAASYLLAPGHFARVIARGGADLVTLPLAPDPRLASIVVERYEQAACALDRGLLGSLDRS